jgi:CRISPR-associated endoribonuclease Cas6
MEALLMYSILLELVAQHAAAIPVSMGHLVQALILNLVKQFDPVLSARLHDEPGYRPYTVSPLNGGTRTGECITLQRDQRCRIRLTLLDGGPLWQNLCTHFLEAEPVYVRLGSCLLQLVRIVSSPHADPSGWVRSTDWQTLFTLSARQSITVRFVTATAFSWGDRRFVVFPEPYLLWEGLKHAWNRYAPACYRIERQGLRASLLSTVAMTKCSLHTCTLHYPNYTQKGFVGTCNYGIQVTSDIAALLTTLAAFAFYAGVGYKTTMGMGQVRVTFNDQLNDVVLLDGARLGAGGNTCITSALER